MERVVIVRYGEIVLKGANRGFFEDKLVSRIKNELKSFDAIRIYKKNSLIYVDVENHNEKEIIKKIKKIFGVILITPAQKINVDMDVVKLTALKELQEVAKTENLSTFKVVTKRANKKFHLKSLEISSEVGGYILGNYKNIKVDVHSPDVTIYVEIREEAYIYSEKIKAYGGLPVGTGGKALLLLSGGIDSPVAGWMIGNRGMQIESLHFHSYPFTSERAKEKVIDLAKQLSSYVGKIKIYSVNLLPIQKEINDKCRSEEMTIISRRFMMKIAEKIAKKRNIDALVTGENLGQVASQTIQSMSVINESVKIPILRPLVAMNKVDIIDRAKEIGTYETSILPFEDCCTVFLPKRPLTKPRLEKILASEEKLDVVFLVDEAIKNMESEMIIGSDQ
ncbi:tRNA 4-thiouridine(8) synthase ThiI [Alkaliphilus sp. AH-315-G20]|nr:tRNA 4-thiouridine(8) synthase ThiI [Alkaliphilus sp. AH-315-G20]